MAEESVEGGSPPGETSRNSEPVATGAIRNRDDVIRTLENFVSTTNRTNHPVGSVIVETCKRLVKRIFLT